MFRSTYLICKEFEETIKALKSFGLSPEDSERFKKVMSKPRNEVSMYGKQILTFDF